MNTEIQNFLSNQATCVLSVVLPDGTLHSATVHFSSVEDPQRFYIQTSNTTLKARPFLGGETKKAAMVIGFSEKEWLTLQMHGDVRMLKEEELEAAYKIHYAKHPRAEKQKGPTTIILEFIPIWWRYSDFNTKPKTVIENKTTS